MFERNASNLQPVKQFDSTFHILIDHDLNGAKYYGINNK